MDATTPGTTWFRGCYLRLKFNYLHGKTIF